MTIQAFQLVVRILLVVGIVLALMLAAGAPSDFPNGRVPISTQTAV
jgi:hypothetical protein